MSGRQRQALVLTSVIGRDGSTDAQIAIPARRAKEVRNADFYRTALARKRGGCADALADTTGEAFTGQISALGRFVAGANEEATELWAVDNAATPVVQRIATGGAVWSSPTLKDNIASRPQDVVFVPFNGKFFVLGDTAADRLHVWDGSTVRRVGLGAPAAGSVANTGAGAYAAVARYYKILYIGSQSRWSEATAVTQFPFTPSGSGTHARITKPAALNEGETHWKIYASLDDTLYFLIATVAVGTGTYDDNTDYATWAAISGNDAIPLVGANIAPFSAKYGMVDGNRLIFAGSWESQFINRVWFTPRLGSSDYADDERIPDTVDQENWIDLDEKDGDSLTAVGGPIQGMPIAFKNRQIWKLRPTLDATEPYAPMAISKSVGAIRQHAVVMAEDQNGDPALYFLSHRGPYRMGMQGLQYLGKDVEDIWTRVNVDASVVSSFALWHEDKHQVWFYVALDTATAPNFVMVFDVQLGETDEKDNIRNGWSTFDGGLAAARCGVMYSETLAATSSRVLLPYLGSNTAATLLRGDSGTTDLTVAYAGYVQFGEKHLAGLTKAVSVTEAIVLGSAGPHSFQCDLSRDYGCETRTDNVSMAPETGDQTRVQRAFEAAFQADAKSVGMQVGDICPTGHAWTLDAVVIQYEERQEVAP